MRRITKTLYFCHECGKAFEGTGDDLPCGHKRYVFDSPLGLRDKVRINAKAIRRWRMGEPPDAPQCIATGKKIEAFFVAISPEN